MKRIGLWLKVLAVSAAFALPVRANMVELDIVDPSRCVALSTTLVSECQRAMAGKGSFTYTVFDGTGASCKTIGDSAIFRECVSELTAKGHWEVSNSRWKASGEDASPRNPMAVPRKDPAERSAAALERIANVQTIALVLECAAVVVIGLIWAFR